MRELPIDLIASALEETDLEFEGVSIGNALRSRSFERIAEWKASEADDRMLFVASAERAETVSKDNPDCSFIFVGPDDVDEPLPNGMHVKTAVAPKTLCDKLRKELQPTIWWIDTMQKYILEGGSLQDLFDVSEDILKNWTMMADSSFRLLACTKNIPVDDEVCISLIEHGYHDDKTAEKLLLGHALAPRGKEAHEGYATGSGALKYPSISRTFVPEEKSVGHVLQVANVVELTPFRQQLFKVFTNHIVLLRKARARQGESALTLQDELLNALATNRVVMSMKKLVYLAKTTGIYYDQSFLFGFVEYTQAAPDFLDGGVLFFERAIPGCSASVNGSRILVLIHARSNFVEKNMKATHEIVESYLEKHHARLYLSAPCYALRDLPYAYRQAEMALQTDEQTLLRNNDRMLLRFSEIALEWLLTTSERDFEFLSYCIAQRPFGRFIRNESESTIEMLRAFLEGERRATPVGKQLAVHRNSLLYQEKRIERDYGISLDDPDVRFEFRYLFRFYDLYANELDLTNPKFPASPSA